MEALIERILNELRGTWRFRRYALAVAWGACFLGWLVVYALPDTFQANARVNVDTRTAIRSAVQGMVVDQDVESQLVLVRQSLLGRANLERVAQEVGLLDNVTSAAQRDSALTRLNMQIEIMLEPPMSRDPRVPNNLYRISYRDENRERAISVVDKLLNAFVEDAMGSERMGTASAQRFLSEQLAQYDQRLAAAESRLAAFKKEHVGLVPGAEGDYFSRLQGEIREIKRIESELAVSTRRRDELQRQLRGETPYVPGDAAAAGGASSPSGPQDTNSRIQEAQARLDDLLLRYTERHPDVIATRETLDQLRARQKQELDALKRGDASAAAISRAASNPVYQNIQLQLNQAEVDIAALRGQLADHRRNEAELRRVVDTVPEVEAEYARLTRDYDVTRAQYNALLERLERTRLSGDAEQTGVVRFDIVDPPAAAFRPIFPNRPVLLAAVFVMAIGAGCAVAFLMHLIKPVFGSSRTLMDVTNVPILGAISRTWVEQYRAQIRRGLLRYTAASALLFVMFIAAVLWQQPASRLVRQLLG